jgi:phosphatidylserine decarboxylase
MMFAKGTSWIIVLPFIILLVIIATFFFIQIEPGTLPGLLLIFMMLVMLVLGFMGLYFFRDPEREIGEGIVSAADGKVTFVKKKKDKVVISVFMNVHNVHVNRAPLAGRIVKIKHFPGSHIPAYNKESERNERVTTDWDTAIGPVRTIQIAGVVARRIVPYVKRGQKLEKGERIGIIRFGSRVDLHLPADKINVKVSNGQAVYAGISTVASIRKGGDRE